MPMQALGLLLHCILPILFGLRLRLIIHLRVIWFIYSLADLLEVRKRTNKANVNLLQEHVLHIWSQDIAVHHSSLNGLLEVIIPHRLAFHAAAAFSLGCKLPFSIGQFRQQR